MKIPITTLLASVSLLLFAGCAHTPPSRALTPEQQVTHGFHQRLGPASSDFTRNLRHYHNTLVEEVDDAVSNMGPSLDALVESLDTYSQRAKASTSDTAKIQDWLNSELSQGVTPALLRFYDSYVTEVADLEARLLVNTDLVPSIAALKRESLRNVTTIQLPTPESLKGNPAVKTAEDALTFIPAVGDAYDVFRSFAYNPRLVHSKENARKCLPKLRALLHKRILAPLCANLPTTEQVQSACSKRFSPAQALQILAKERNENLPQSH